MAATVKDGDIHVTFEDQQKINRFARTNARLVDVKEELSAKEKELENLTYAEEEIMLLDADSDTIGEVLVEMTIEEAQAALEKAKETCLEEIAALKENAESHKQILGELKTQLYAKFGSNINLDLDDES
ncbi:unnamed protein product [Candidula unifasciata]|uniref:Prefoldin subunit 4 n=1 Tax=Candidula unifasciata TaxID=100452 RepID=A0A8S3ZPQ8_9EUPU|nr:unnamed protein product [Candidula unifasciata]